MTMNAPEFSLTGIKKFYNSHPAVDIDNFSIAQSSITGLVGPNGSGKSTLLNMLAFIDSPSEGTILFKGCKAEPFSDNVRFKVSMLPQETYLLKRSVYDNICYGLKLRGSDPAEYGKKIDEVLSLVGLSPREFSNRRWYQLSGGEAQRVALAARLVLKPEVLILDEPTASVDVDSAGRIMDCAFMASKEWGATLIIASHDWKWLHEICGNVLQMFRGRIIGNSMENIIFGPWSQKADKSWEKKLEDGQRIRVTAPPSTASAAVIRHNLITITPDPPVLKDDEHVLSGIITQLSLEPSANTVMASVRAGGLVFMLRVSRDKIPSAYLYPGNRIYISYPLSSVNWY